MPFLFLASESSTLSPILRDLLLILAAAGVVAVLAQRLRLPTIPAYLITGTLIGPGAVGLVHDAKSVEDISNLAIILLMFGIGLHMDLSVLRDTLRRAIIATVLLTTICAAALWPVGAIMKLSTPSNISVGIALAISSTVVVLRILSERRELNKAEGRLSTAVLVLQDLVAIALLLVLPPLAKWNGTGTAGVLASADELSAWGVALEMGINALIAMLGVAALVGFGKFILPWALEQAAKRANSGEVTTVISIAAALGAAGITQIVGLGPALGAFLAGFMLSLTMFRHQLGSQIGAVRDLFAAVFFTAVGMSVDLQVLWDNLPQIALMTVLMLGIKAVVIGLVLWGTGATGNLAFRGGVYLAQAGEFSIVILTVCVSDRLKLLTPEQAGQIVSVVVLSLILTPAMVLGAVKIGARLPAIDTAPWARRHVGGATSEVAGFVRGKKHAIIAGYGLVGRAVADELKKMQITSTIVEMNPSTVKRQATLGRPIIFGDIAAPEILESAGIHDADALILTIPDEESVLRACKQARQMHPDIPIIARCNFVSQGVLAAGLGASGVVVEEMATAKEMERVVGQVLSRVETPATAA
ncbi:MAG: cation:proton antiporter [Phycisphaerales bacterium]